MQFQIETRIETPGKIQLSCEGKGPSVSSELESETFGNDTDGARNIACALLRLLSTFGR